MKGGNTITPKIEAVASKRAAESARVTATIAQMNKGPIGNAPQMPSRTNFFSKLMTPAPKAMRIQAPNMQV
jgi:hypothetical protein